MLINHYKFQSLILVLVLYSSWGAMAEELKPVVNISELIQKANTGDMNSQLALANAYFHGEGAVEDNNKAFDWYLKAAL